MEVILITLNAPCVCQVLLAIRYGPSVRLVMLCMIRRLVAVPAIRHPAESQVLTWAFMFLARLSLVIFLEHWCDWRHW